MKIQLRHKISATVVALAIGLLGAVVAVPVSASAHTASVTGVADCTTSTGAAVVTWTVTNDWSTTMTVAASDNAAIKVGETVDAGKSKTFTQNINAPAGGKTVSVKLGYDWNDFSIPDSDKSGSASATVGQNCTTPNPPDECITAVWTIPKGDSTNPFEVPQVLWGTERTKCNDLDHPVPPTAVCGVAYQVDSYLYEDSKSLLAAGNGKATLSSSAQDGAFLQSAKVIPAKDAKDCTPTPPTKPNPEKGSDPTYAADCGPTLITTVTPWTQDYTLDTKTNTWVLGAKVTGKPVVTTTAATEADLKAHNLTVPTNCTPTPPTKPNPEKGSDPTYAADCGPTLITTVTPWTQDYTLDTASNTWVKGPKVTGTPVVTSAPATQADLDAHHLTVPTTCVPPQPKDLSGSDTTYAVDCALTLTTTVTPWTQAYTLDTASNTWVLGAKVTGTPVATTSTTTIDALPALGLTAPVNCAVTPPTPPVTPPTPPVTPPTPPVTPPTPPTAVVTPPAVEAPVVTPVTKVDAPTVTTPKVEAPVVKATDTDSPTSLASTGINDSTPIAGDLALGALALGAALIAVGAIRRRRALTK